jgi:6-hydroxytryprostatin B O-methyltransferase
MAFTTIAKSILHDAEILDAFIRDNNLPEPSFDANGPLRTPWSSSKVVEAHSNLLANTHKLHRLTEGPASAWMGGLNGAGGDLLTNTAIVHFDIASHVPLDGTAKFADVAPKCGMALRDFKMIVRYAMTNFIFCEPEVEVIAHTASSKALVQNKLLQSMSKMGCDEIVPALGKVRNLGCNYLDGIVTM